MKHLTRRQFLTAAALCAPSLVSNAQSLSLRDIAFVGRRHSSSSGNTGCDPAALTNYTYGGDTFECYADEDPLVTTLSYGVGWTGDWATGIYQLRGVDDFESYAAGSISASSMSAGSNWTGAWAQ